MSYCNLTTDLTDVYPKLSEYDLKRVVEEWTITSGQTYTYYKGSVGQVNQVFEDDVQLTIQTSIANVEANVGSWYYDSDGDILYVQTTGTDIPNDTYVIEIGEDWDTFLGRCRNDAQELIDGWLNKVMNTPLLARDAKDHSSNDYELPIRRSCAALVCYFIINRRNPNDPEANDLYKVAWNPEPEEGEAIGFINQYISGDLVRQDIVSPREAGNYNVFPYSGNTTAELGVELEGNYTGSIFMNLLLTITTGGAPGTAVYKLSLDNGTTDTYTDQETLKDGNNTFVPLYGGINVRFPASSYTENDYWQIRVYPQDSTLEGGNKIGTICLER